MRESWVTLEVYLVMPLLFTDFQQGTRYPLPHYLHLNPINDLLTLEEYGQEWGDTSKTVRWEWNFILVKSFDEVQFNVWANLKIKQTCFQSFKFIQLKLMQMRHCDIDRQFCQTPSPGADTPPPPLDRHPPGETPPGETPPSADTPLRQTSPRADTPLSNTKPHAV